jgi:hypothetical protein
MILILGCNFGLFGSFKKARKTVGKFHVVMSFSNGFSCQRRIPVAYVL